jgi:precorrin-4 methylase
MSRGHYRLYAEARIQRANEERQERTFEDGLQRLQASLQQVAKVYNNFNPSKIISKRLECASEPDYDAIAATLEDILAAIRDAGIPQSGESK